MFASLVWLYASQGTNLFSEFKSSHFMVVCLWAKAETITILKMINFGLKWERILQIYSIRKLNFWSVEYRYSKFYRKKVIQIDRVELSTKISHVKNYPGELSKIF